MKTKITIIVSIILLVSIPNIAFASHVISCDSSQTIQWNEELQDKECVDDIEELDMFTEVQEKKKSDNKPFNLEGISFEGTEIGKETIKTIPVEIQHMENDKKHTVKERTNYYFKFILQSENSKAKDKFSQIYGNFENIDFGQNNKRQIIYDISPDRFDDPEFVKKVLDEIKKAEEWCLKTWEKYPFTNEHMLTAAIVNLND